MNIFEMILQRGGVVFWLLVVLLHPATGQIETYEDSISAFQQNYVNNHEVVSKEDKKYIHFYPIDKGYRVEAAFKQIKDDKGFGMNTASGKRQHYFKYGMLTFNVNHTAAHLFIYQSQSLLREPDLKDYLFVPFGDATSGFSSFGGGRYLDFRIADIRQGRMLIDFNKAYNPYCAYASGYDCPIPPKENLLTISIPAGEQNYGKPMH
jgi:uncharacterized protein (DUF1684 family)